MNSLISKLGLGTVQFGVNYGISNKEGKTSMDEVKNIMDYAAKVGIEYIDTASAYGTAEEVIGNFDLSSFKIVSKYIPKTDLTLTSQFKESLSRMNLINIYGYMAHRPLDLIEDNCGPWKQLQKLKNDGLVKKIGASFNSIEEFEKIKSYNIELDIIQVPFNYFDHRFVSVMKELKSKNCEIHTRSTFLQGLFFCPPQSLSSFFQNIKEDLKHLQKYDNLANRLLVYSLKNKDIDVVNIGVNNLDQLKVNIEEIEQNSIDLPIFNKQIDKKILIPSLWP